MWCQEHFLYLYFLYKTHDGHIHGTFFALLLKFCKGSVRVSLLYQTFNCLITTGVANNTRSVHSLFFFSCVQKLLVRFWDKNPGTWCKITDSNRAVFNKCRKWKCMGLAILLFVIVPKQPRQNLNRSDSKPKPVTTESPVSLSRFMLFACSYFEFSLAPCSFVQIAALLFCVWS